MTFLSCTSTWLFSHCDSIKVREADLFNSRHKLLRHVGSNSLVFKLQLCVMLWLKRLKDPDDFTVLPRAAALFLVSEVKPEGGKKRDKKYVEAAQHIR